MFRPRSLRDPWLCVAVLLAALLPAACADAQSLPTGASAWQTDWSKRSIDLDELMAGGPPKDGIPSINRPQFVSVEAAGAWLQPQEPVIALVVEGEARAYPLQIMTWHEIAIDEVGGVPVVVTFCPLCYSAIAYDRRVEGQTLTFGVSGMLRHSDLVMFDRQTESLWQQLSGEAIVGRYTGAKLTPLPAQILAFKQFAEAYPGGQVLSRETGYLRDYGRNPYAGYDDVGERPFLYRGPRDERLPPMEKVVALSLGGQDKAYPHRLTRLRRVVEDEVDGQPVVVFHADGAVSALDAAQISASREIGSTGVFDPRLDGQRLSFRYEGGRFVDAQTQSTWDVTGRAVAGTLAGRRLRPIPHGDYFAFAWFAFKPKTALYAE